MQQQSAQNIFVPPAGTNSTGNVRTNPQNGMFRAPPSNSAPRNRHMHMPSMYQSTVQSVVIPYPQYQTRQPQYPQFPYASPQFYPQNSYFPYYPTLQQPQHQRPGVGVGAGVSVGVSSAMPVQPGPVAGPGNAPQAPMSLGVAPGTSAVLGVANPALGQPVGVTQMVGVGTTQPTQTTVKIRKHAIEIIDPDTNRNIFDDSKLEKNPTNIDNEYQKPVFTQMEGLITAPQPPDHPNICRSSGAVTSEARPYNSDMHQIPQQRDTNSQTPVVSAMSDAPSVEILPTPPQKPRNKKTLNAPSKQEQNTTQNISKTDVDTKQHTDEAAATNFKSNCVQDQIAQQYPTTQVPQITTHHQQQQLQQPSTGSAYFPEEDVKPTASVNEEPLLNRSQTVAVTPDLNSSNCILNLQQQQQQQQQQTQQQQQHQPQQEQSQEQVSSAEQDILESSALSSVSEITDSVYTMQLDEKELPISQSATDSEQQTAQVTSDAVPSSNGITTNPSEPTKEVEDISKETLNNNVTMSIYEIPANPKFDNLDVKNDNIVKKGNNLLNETSTTTTGACDETDRTVKPSPSTTSSTASETSVQPISQQESRTVHSPDKGANTDKDNKNVKSKSEINDKSKVNVASTTVSESPSASSNTTKDNLNPAKTKPVDVNTNVYQSLISYNEGQWSPNNPSGKKQYDREQLMQLREAKASRIQPEVKNPAILPQPNLMPSFMRHTQKNVQTIMGSIGGSRSGESGNKNFMKQSSISGTHNRNSSKAMIHVNLSLNQDVKLNETDNAWRPRVLAKKDEDEVDPEAKSKREKEELLRKVRGILNKLTPEKFDALVEEILKLKIDTMDKMEAVMILVFEKAIDEPNFSVSYARLCHRLSNEVKAQDERMESGTKSNLSYFRSALLDKTEREFTENVIKAKSKQAKLQPIIDKIKNCKDPNEKVELEALLEEEERKIRRRSGGTVRFIGELFKISILTGKIIYSCILKLMNPESEDMLECLCKLLTTVGAKVEQTVIPKEEPKRYYSIESTIKDMQAIANKSEGSNISSRVRFMLQDVIDLRKNNWQSTRNEAPKTMEQIEKEARNEQLSSQYLNYNVSLPAGGSGAGSGSVKRDDRGGRFADGRSSSGYGGSHSQRGDAGSLRRTQQGSSSQSGHSNTNNDDTWHVQTSKGGRVLPVDTNKLEGLRTQNLDNKKMGGVSQFQWNNTARQSSASTTVPSNSFAALSMLDSNKGISEGDRDRSGPRNKGFYNKGSMERDRYGDRGIHSRTGSSQASRENSSSRGSQGSRGMMNSSAMQKSASHSKYSQQVPSARISGKPSATVPMYRGDQQLSSSSLSPSYRSSDVNPSVAPPAVFEQPSDSDLKLMHSVVSEMVENALVSSHPIDSTTVACIKGIKDNQRCGLLYYILTDYLHLSDVGSLYRRYLGNIVIYLIENNFLSMEHFRLAYKYFAELASDLIVDIPELWLYIFDFTGPLIVKNYITVNDLWITQLKDSSNFGIKFLKTFLTYCTREIGPSFTRNMWKTLNMKWSDYMPESEVAKFIKTNKFEYIEDETSRPEIDTKEPEDKRIKRVVEHVDQLLKEGAKADVIIDYINGNIVEVNKMFIRSLTTTLSNFAIKDNFKLDTTCFQKVCVPVLLRYLDSVEERELECLYAMQLLVHRMEHPRGLLSDLFGELNDAELISQDSFIKWRDCKDQSLGKGVAVKALNPFFNLVLNDETSDD